VKLLSLARDLKRRKARDRQGLFVAEGVRTVEALLDSPLRVRGVLCTAALDDRARHLRARASARNIDIHEVSEAEFASAADTEAPQGILAVATIPRRNTGDLPDRGDLLVLDAVQDPGNVGTIIRSAAALGASATIALPGTVDLWNAKVVRSAMGALFTHPVAALDWEQAHEWLQAQGLQLWVAAADGELVGRAMASRTGRVAVVVANEGAGVSAHVARAAHRRVAIAMEPPADSLNVAVAAGILLHELRHQPL
jgi:RNA methyltransferase, TrmH family